MKMETIISLPDLEPLIRKYGTVTFTVAGNPITFDLSYSHERAYAVKFLLEVRYPQADIDSLLFRRFVRAGDIVLDAGANIGVTTLECLEAGAAKVIAVEALPSLYDRLSRLANRKIIPVGEAISKTSGRAEFFVSQAHNQGSSLSPEMVHLFPTVFGDHFQKVQVVLTTIDQLSERFGAFDVWKLDIEGAEIDAVKGAEKTLADRPPRIIIAELYRHLFDGFNAIVRATHPYVYRAFISTERYELDLRPAAQEAPEGVQRTSPMYVFSQNALSDM